jgi:hypothetical protein
LLEPTKSHDAADQELEALWQWEEEQRAVGERWSDTLDRMTATPPSTKQGATAMIHSYLKCEGNNVPKEHRCIELLRSLLGFLDVAA